MVSSHANRAARAFLAIETPEWELMEKFGKFPRSDSFPQPPMIH